MRYAIVKSQDYGLTQQYDYGEFSHETPKKFVLKHPVGYKKIFDKSDLVCLVETKDLAELIVGAFETHRERYLESCKKALDLYEQGVDIIISESRDRADAETLEVKKAMDPPKKPSQKQIRQRGFKPKIVGGRDE